MRKARNIITVLLMAIILTSCMIVAAPDIPLWLRGSWNGIYTVDTLYVTSERIYGTIEGRIIDIQLYGPDTQIEEFSSTGSHGMNSLSLSISAAPAPAYRRVEYIRVEETMPSFSVDVYVRFADGHRAEASYMR